MIKKKRQILSAALIIVLCSVIAVNWYLSEPDNSKEGSSVSREYISGNLGDSLFVAGTTSPDATSGTESISDDSVSAESNEEYFFNAKLKRQNTYDAITDSIEDMLEQENLNQEMKNTITTILSDFQRDMKLQTDAENIISAKTGSECLVVINAGKCEVILQKNTLNDSLVLQISEIIQKNTNISAENLTIIELK